MMRTTVLAVVMLVATATAVLAAEPWVEAKLGFTTYDLSDVNNDITDPLRDFGFVYGEDQTIESALTYGAAVGLRLGAWNVSVNFDMLPGSSTFDQTERVNLSPGLSTDYLDYDVGASAIYLTVDRLMGDERDNPRVVYGISGGLVSGDASIDIDVLDVFSGGEEERLSTSGSGTGLYADVHVKVNIDLGAVFIEPELGYRYAAAEVDDFDAEFLLDGNDEIVFDVEDLDYTGMIFRVGIGYMFGRQ